MKQEPYRCINCKSLNVEPDDFQRKVLCLDCNAESMPHCYKCEESLNTGNCKCGIIYMIGFYREGPPDFQNVSPGLRRLVNSGENNE